MSSPLATCSNCTLPVLPEFYFCPNCGKQLRSKPITVSAGRQIGLYVLSIFIPPLAFPFALRYIKQSNKQTKTIGIVILSIIIISIGLSLYAYILFVQKFYSIYTQLTPTQIYGY